MSIPNALISGSAFNGNTIQGTRPFSVIPGRELTNYVSLTDWCAGNSITKRIGYELIKRKLLIGQHPSAGSLTSRFTNARAFYIDAPLLSGIELEIDCFLQVYFPAGAGERVRNLRLGSIKDGVIKLNETDTETVVPIPSEFVDSGLPMALFFLASDTTFLEVYVLGSDCTLCGVKDDLVAISDRLDELESKIDNLVAANSNTTSNLTNLTTILNLILTAVS